MLKRDNTIQILNLYKVYGQFEEASLKILWCIQDGPPKARYELKRPSRRTLLAISLAIWFDKIDSVSKTTDWNIKHNSCISRRKMRNRGQSFGHLTASPTSLKSEPIIVSVYPKSFILRSVQIRHLSYDVSLLGEEVMASPLAWWRTLPWWSPII